MTDFKSIRDMTIGELFDGMCKRYDECGRNEYIVAFFKGKHPCTDEVFELRVELSE
jgi:hypothetical protein